MDTYCLTDIYEKYIKVFIKKYGQKYNISCNNNHRLCLSQDTQSDRNFKMIFSHSMITLNHLYKT